MQIMDQFGAAPGAESVRMPDGTERTLAAEHAAAILVNEQPAFRVVCTPELLPQLALGRLLTEGWITCADEVEQIAVCAEGLKVSVISPPDGRRTVSAPGRLLKRSAITIRSLPDVSKARLDLAVPLHRLAPHGRRAHPKVVVAIEGTVDHQLLLGLAVVCHAQHLVLVALEMPVAAGLDVVLEIHPAFLPIVFLYCTMVFSG